MATLISDSFPVNGGLGANWTTITGRNAPAIVGNAVQVSVGGETPCGALYTATALPTDQWAQLRMLALGPDNNYNLAVLCRADSDVSNCYGVFVNGPFGAAGGEAGDTVTFVVASGTYTQLGATSVALAANDLLYLEAVGSQITSKVAGVTVHSVSDATVAAGRAGIDLYNLNTVTLTLAQLDDFTAGDFAGGFVPAWAQGANVLVGSPA